jgi:hypothetical protein
LPFGGIVVNDYSLTRLVNPGAGRLWAVTFVDSSLGGRLEAMQVPSNYNQLTGSDVSIAVLSGGEAVPASKVTTNTTSVAGNEVGGSFYLSLDGYSVGPIDYNVADTVMKTQLEQLPNVGVVSVQRIGPTVLKEYSWLVTFVSTPGYFPPGSGNVDTLVATYASTLVGNSSTVVVTTVVDGSLPLSGTFTLTMSNGTFFETTTDIPADASDSELEAHLNSLNSVGTVSVTRSVLGNGYSWLVTFDGCKVLNGTDVCNEGPVPLLQYNSSLVQCAAAPMSVINVITGSGPGNDCPQGNCVGLLTDLSGAQPFTYVLSSLNTGVPYYVRVAAHSAQGYGLPAISEPEFFITTYNPPGPPLPVRLLSSTISSITVAWDLPPVNGGAAVVGYELWMDDWAGGNPRLVYDGTDVPNVTQFDVGSINSVVLSAGKSYRFMVRAVNYCISTKPTTICLGAFSDQAIFTVRAPRAPLAPLGPYKSSRTNIGTAASGDATIVINWSPPVDNGGSQITTYLIYWAAPGAVAYTEVDTQGIPPASVASGNQVLQWSFSNLLEGNAYRFYIVAVNALGRSAASPVLSAVAGVLPGIDFAGNLVYASVVPTITGVDSSSVSLSWPMPSSNSTGGSAVTGYKVWMFPGVPLNSLTNPVVVFQDVQMVSTRLGSGSTPLSGSFTLSFNGSTTPDLAFNITAVDMKAALEDLPGVLYVSINQVVNAFSGYNWLITFNAVAGDLPLLHATAGKLAPSSNAGITVVAVVPGTPAVLVYNGANVPEIRSVQIPYLLPDTTYAFKVAPLNSLGDGMLSAPTVTVVTTAGASAAYTTASGSSLSQGITYGINEQQLVTTANCGNSLINVFYHGNNISFSNNMTVADIEYAMVTAFDLNLIIDKSFSVNASVDILSYMIAFQFAGDVDLFNAFSPTDVNCIATVSEFIRGSVNEFTIEPKKLSGEVLKDIVTAAGFAGQDLFLTEMFLNGAWYRDQGVANYNPVVYTIQSIFIPISQGGNIVLQLPDYLTPTSVANFSTTAFASASSSLVVQNAIEALNNVKSVDVSRIVSAGGVTFLVTFLSNLGYVPILQSFNNLINIQILQTGICDVQAIILATDSDFSSLPSNGTFTISYEGEYTPDININADESEMKTKLESLSQIGTVKVNRQTNGNGFRWTVSFTENVGDLRLMQAIPYRYEVQLLQTSGGSPTPLSGIMTLSYGGDSVTVNYDASASDMQSALESMPSVGAVEVVKTFGSNGQNLWMITFRALIGNVDLVTVDSSLLFGSDASAKISQVVPGNGQTLMGYNPRLNVMKVVSGRPDYTGSYSVDVPGQYQIAVSQLIAGGLSAQYWDNQVCL